MRFGRAIIVAILVQGAAGCSREPGPTSPGEVVSLAVSAIVPQTGLIGSAVRISGVGFSAGATVTLGGAATHIVVLGPNVITATAPLDASGTVDVIVTNPDGKRATLTGGFSYATVALTVSASEVAPGGPLSVSWVAPSGRSGGDWMGLFKVGAPSTSYLDGWWNYTNDTTSGTLTLTAPSEPGQYEFRYLLDDGYIDVARSPVTVRSSGG